MIVSAVPQNTIWTRTSRPWSTCLRIFYFAGTINNSTIIFLRELYYILFCGRDILYFFFAGRDIYIYFFAGRDILYTIFFFRLSTLRGTTPAAWIYGALTASTLTKSTVFVHWLNVYRLRKANPSGIVFIRGTLLNGTPNPIFLGSISAISGNPIETSSFIGRFRWRRGTTPPYGFYIILYYILFCGRDIELFGCAGKSGFFFGGSVGRNFRSVHTSSISGR